MKNLIAGAACLLAAPSVLCAALVPQGGGGIPECEVMNTTDSGLQWGVLKKGSDQPSPTADDAVEVHYTGWLTDGTKFDSSRDRGSPAKFPLRNVIKGWTEGLQLMSPGARFKFVIPGDLGYGAAGSPPKIPANATLVFDVELLKVVRMPKMRPANPDAQKTTESGIKYEVVAPGSGPECGAANGLSLRYAIWKAEGQLVECSEQNDNHYLSGTLETLDVPFLKELMKSCKQGEIVRAEVPRAQFPNIGSDTVWELEVMSITTLPEFRMPDPAKIVTTQSGLQYEVIHMGSGDSPKATDTVSANYTGWLTDGKMFDSSHARGAPTEFALNRVIKGWTEGLQLMKPGGTFLFVIPPELGYGPRGAGEKIPANATLVFLVELVSVKKS
jgi:FKBP-type peptidyl-prolyl cis-trans isomerase